MKEISSAIPAHLMEPDIASGPKARNIMGKDDFLKLLMAQLQHQDPLKPMDHQEFASQLAQFGQLEQLTNIGSGIQGLRTGMGEGSKLQALGMIGKRVSATINEIELLEGQPATLQYSSDPNLQPVKATVFEATGKPVREINLAGKPNGEEITWDGKNQDGVQLPSGKYTFRVHGVGKNGQAGEVSTELSGRVVGMEMRGENPVLLLEGSKGRLELNRVSKVLSDTEATTVGGISAVPKMVASNQPKPIQDATVSAIKQPMLKASTPEELEDLPDEVKESLPNEIREVLFR